MKAREGFQRHLHHVLGTSEEREQGEIARVGVYSGAEAGLGAVGGPSARAEVATAGCEAHGIAGGPAAPRGWWRRCWSLQLRKQKPYTHPLS